MTITTETIVRLDEKETNALKLLLGNLSQVQKVDLGLTVQQSDIISEIWGSLPDDEDEQ